MRPPHRVARRKDQRSQITNRISAIENQSMDRQAWSSRLAKMYQKQKEFVV
jgi:hypothetical protein